jgi:hypothetical protein
MPSIEGFFLTPLEPYRRSCSVNSSWSSKLRSVLLLLEGPVKEDEPYR